MTFYLDRKMTRFSMVGKGRKEGEEQTSDNNRSNSSSTTSPPDQKSKPRQEFWNFLSNSNSVLDQHFGL